ncbi:tyrosine-type recombinase/integrase [Pelosinus propionicus]|uniref:Phage integrase family protein n=1 Tax=Pelosinus propionicus DSM 13327 TaxID=1123291 RepID=A0A1I4PHH5_9FIRM|nr:tyrosine-type recombinase/integrase [Pelosinus propionicus]SFM26873.1 Phage integrase family protein [Pelosinus propionicus DSM 13327]
MLTREKYCSLSIDGLNYVRPLKKFGGTPAFYILINNENKPIEDVFYFLKYLAKNKGEQLNTLKRTAYDLCHFYDFMLVNNISVELIDRAVLKHFIMEYLPLIETKKRVRNCIERSIMKKLPIKDIHKPDSKAKAFNRYTSAHTKESFKRIINNVKHFLCYLVKKKKISIALNDMFDLLPVKKDTDSSMLSHITRDGITYFYSAGSLFKSCGITIQLNIKIRPVEESMIFEAEEEDEFFFNLRDYPPMYRLYYYLLDETGMRAAEGLALKIFDVPMNRLTYDFTKIQGDIRLVDDEKDHWQVYIFVREDNPPDLKIKFNKERVVDIVDSSHTLRNLLTNALNYRRIQFRKMPLSKKHDFLFTNRNGTRLKYNSVRDTFNDVLDKTGLSDRKGEPNLVIHSFRHTYATNWIKHVYNKAKDVELDILSGQLGHANGKITRNTYVHFFKKEKLELLKKIERAKRQGVKKDELSK